MLDHRGIVHDFDLPLKILEAHPAAVTLLVKVPQLRLIAVMIRRSEQRAADPVARDVCEVPLDRLGLRLLDRVELVAHRGERIRLERFRFHRRRAVLAELVQHRAFRRGQSHIIALGFIKKEPSQREDRIGDGV